MLFVYEKEYHVDGKQVTWDELINMATDLYGYQAKHGIKLTSEAAEILRENGHTVGRSEDLFPETFPNTH
jgi:hypothetical protein